MVSQKVKTAKTNSRTHAMKQTRRHSRTRSNAELTTRPDQIQVLCTKVGFTTEEDGDLAYEGDIADSEEDEAEEASNNRRLLQLRRRAGGLRSRSLRSNGARGHIAKSNAILQHSTSTLHILQNRLLLKKEAAALGDKDRRSLQNTEPSLLKKHLYSLFHNCISTSRVFVLSLRQHSYASHRSETQLRYFHSSTVDIIIASFSRPWKPSDGRNFNIVE